ncbi:t-SNARE [Auricularia subglabra TFB-10046 SS5]|nr:t-SNARE [Auricularia subglabra TFB-10046 SS5]
MTMPVSSSKVFSTKPPAYAELAAGEIEEAEDVTEASYRDIHEDFLTEVSSIQGLITQLRGSVVSLGKLRARRYSAFLEPEPEDGSADDVVQRIARLVDDIDARLAAFGSSRSASVLQATPAQAALLRARFLEALRAYHAVERDARMRLRARIARQFRVVHPDATVSDVRRAAEGRPAQELLRSDLGKSRRYGEGRKALQEVQERQAELAQLESSLEKLSTIIERVNAEVERDNLSVPHRRVVPPIPDTASTDKKTGANTSLVDSEPVRERRHRRGMCGLLLVLVFSAIIGILVVAAVVAANLFGH